MGNFEDNYIGSADLFCAQLREKSQKDAPKMEKKVLKFCTNSQKVPDK